MTSYTQKYDVCEKRLHALVATQQKLLHLQFQQRRIFSNMQVTTANVGLYMFAIESYWATDKERRSFNLKVEATIAARNLLLEVVLGAVGLP